MRKNNVMSTALKPHYIGVWQDLKIKVIQALCPVTGWLKSINPKRFRILVEQQNLGHGVFGISLTDLKPLRLSVLWLATDILALLMSDLFKNLAHLENLEHEAFRI